MAIDVVRAMKDAEYRKTLTPEQIASLPQVKAGEELSEEEIAKISGGPIYMHGTGGGAG